MSLRKSDKVTKRQQAVLDAIERYIQSHGYGPSVRELTEELGLASPSTVFVHLKALQEKGMIVRDPFKSRSITLTRSSDNESSFIFASANESRVMDLPVVGEVAAGTPLLAEENITQYLSLPEDIVGDSASFVLKVHGESMVEAGINDGDYVVVKQQRIADNGDIVVALLDEGATVKRFYKEQFFVRLQPENSSMEPIITSDCSIAGKVVAVFRRL